ncbi:hypothetical protein SODALDRAFT_107312 [Sodiomyces alkalinus F11]|uniref:Uncharacterized protein n=1 Tax=Sodiomyces alkalinus (strain CBS 110278 / VKM F-3762 / F11) TaxID=1314773 RepID=A0A3N2Q2B9_SODAK|nr:hypothetical protein SODALDRAFT_107312 [Sodiomyces alkalinus F11]ROT40900.1 hypothetical protein SODALDRAFT_107312 [Sodiomyces alkalinus F11]
MGRRNSSPRTTEERGRRPNLRSCATEPSITASNVSRGALAFPHSAHRAADLLTRVAIFTSPGGIADLPSRDVPSPSSVSSRGSAESFVRSRAVDMPSTPPRHEGALDGSPASVDSGSYFSFPSLDEWEGDKVDEENAGFS